MDRDERDTAVLALSRSDTLCVIARARIFPVASLSLSQSLLEFVILSQEILLENFRGLSLLLDNRFNLIKLLLFLFMLFRVNVELHGVLHFLDFDL